MTAILAILMLLQAPQVETGALDRLADAVVLRLAESRAAGFHSIVIGEGLVTVTPELPAQILEDYRVYRRGDEARFEWRAVKRLGARDLETLKAGRPVGGVEPGDLLLRDGRGPAVALSVAVGEAAEGGFSRQLKAAIAERLDRSGVFAFKPADATEASLEAQAPQRENLAEQGIDVLLTVDAHRMAGQLVLICRVYAVNQELDGFFSLTTPLEADLALLLQHDAEAGQGGGLLILTSPLPGGLLDLAAANVDGAEGDELIALTRERLLIYKVADRRLELSRIVELEDLPRARFATRMPAGRVVPIDIDGNGRTELLIGSNLFAGGAVVWLERDHVSFRLLDFQPLERTTFGGGPAFLCGRYRSGEDTFEDSIFISDEEFTVRKLADFKSTRSMCRLDDEGRELMVEPSMGQVAHWKPAESFSEQPMSLVAPGAVFGGPAGDGSYLRAEPAAGGFRVVAVESESHDASATAILTPLDIEALAAYNPPGPAEKAVAVCGRDNRGGVVLALYSWPW